MELFLRIEVYLVLSLYQLLQYFGDKFIKNKVLPIEKNNKEN